jgi:alkylated DNA repair dioxygenase AlkB
MTAEQTDLFAPLRALPEGLRYQDDFLDAEEENALMAELAVLPLQEARYKEWAAKRRVVSYGGRYDFDRNVLVPEQPIPPFLFGLRARAAHWMSVEAGQLDHALVAEYRPGTQLGWHRDVPEFGAVVGMSLAGAATMRLRRYPHVVRTRERALSLELTPRSIYSLRGDARWQWQHAISPTKTLRYSITFRALRR